MKRFLIILALGLAASDKLDRTYLPPPGAHLSGGSLGDVDLPLELPHSGQQTNQRGSHEETQYFGINRGLLNFGDKIPKGPTTTISYAFSQTTNFPPAESLETTVLPINPVTGFPINLDQSQGQSHAPNIRISEQPGFDLQGPTSGTANHGHGQSTDQLFDQYRGQNIIGSGSVPIPKLPSQMYQNQLDEYADGKNPVSGQSKVFPSSDNQLLIPYRGQNQDIPRVLVQIPGNFQTTQYPRGETSENFEQEGFVPSTPFPQGSVTLQPGTEHGGHYAESQKTIPQEIFPSQSNYSQNQGEFPQNQGYYQGQKPSFKQYSNGNQNLIAPGLGEFNKVFRPDSTSTAFPSSYYNDFSNTTPLPDIPSSTSYSSTGLVYRSERPEAAADRTAVILNYENIRTPNGYSYSFDTSNGIHADENGIVDHGTKVQGSYSYTGDDGKVYSVIYTADENGFQPRGDHLPTPPPIPEAIKKVIEQAMRDKAAGIIDDGSYDEAKYGEKEYQSNANSRRPQNKQRNRLDKNLLNEERSVLVKPIAGINKHEYNEYKSQNQFNNNLPADNSTKVIEEFSNLRNLEPNVSDGRWKKKVSGIDQMPSGNINDNDIVNIEENGINNKPGSLRLNQMTSYSSPVNRAKTQYDRPTSNVVEKDGKTTYPESEIKSDGTDGYSKSKSNRFGNTKYQGSESGKTRVPESGSLHNGSDENTNVDSFKDAPISISNMKPTLRQRVNGNNTGKPRNETFSQENLLPPSISNYIKNAANQPILNHQIIEEDGTGYHYQPTTKLNAQTKFEQNKFSKKISPEDVSSTTKPDQRRTEFIKGTTPRPFLTPNVYYQNNESRQSTTRRPFQTVGVTSPTKSSHTDYDDDEYDTEQNRDDDRIDSTRVLTENADITSQPYQSIQTTSKPYYAPASQTTRVTQKGTPEYNSRSSEPITTSTQSHSSRFGTTEAPSRLKSPQHRPTTTQAPSGTETLNYKYQTAGPIPGHSNTNLLPGSTVIGVIPGFSSESSMLGRSNPQKYSTNPYLPVTGHPSTTTVSPTTAYNEGFGASDPFMPFENSHSSTSDTFGTGYHYGPPKLEFFTPSTPGKFATSYPDTTKEYQQNSYSTTTPILSTPGTFVLSQSGNTSPDSSPYGPYQGNYQNGLYAPQSQFGNSVIDSSPFGTYQENNSNIPFGSNYSSTIMPSTHGTGPVFGTFEYPVKGGSEFNPLRPSSTGSFSTVGTTPVSFIPSSTPGVPSQVLSTAYPIIQTTKDTFVSGPAVDGFGRPITTEQRDTYPGFVYREQDPRGSSNQGQEYIRLPQDINNNVPAGNAPVSKFSDSGTVPSTVYPKSYDQSGYIGEDFSGPKQPQRYDSMTGYHYK